MNLDKILDEYIDKYGNIICCDMFCGESWLDVTFENQRKILLYYNNTLNNWELSSDQLVFNIGAELSYMRKFCNDMFNLYNAPDMANIDKVLELARDLGNL